jgi:hypothetical protein
VRVYGFPPSSHLVVLGGKRLKLVLHDGIVEFFLRMKPVAICVVPLPGTVRGEARGRGGAGGSCERTELGKHPKHRPAKTPAHTG